MLKGVVFATVDAAKETDLVTKYDVKALPTLYAFPKGLYTRILTGCVRVSTMC